MTPELIGEMVFCGAMLQFVCDMVSFGIKKVFSILNMVR